MNRLQLLYENEINCAVEWFWDGGVDWFLGDHWNGWKVDGNSDTVEEAVDALWEAARAHYPENELWRSHA